MPTKSLLNLAVDLQAVGLAKHNLDLAMKKKKSVGDFVKTGATTIVGTELIRLQKGFISGI